MKNVRIRKGKFHVSHDMFQIALWILFIFHCSFFIVHFFSTPVSAQPDPFTIAIVQPHDVSAYQEAVEGFLKFLQHSLNQDFKPIIYESPQGLYAALQQGNDNPAGPVSVNLILTVGTEATAEIARHITDIPIVFTMVLDPETILNQRQDIVGASLNIPDGFQFNMIKEILPEAKRIGLLYDPAKNAGIVTAITAIAEQFQLQIKPFRVTSPKDIPTALKQLSKEADVLWGIVDSTVYTSQTTKFIIRYTVKAQIPFIGLSASYVKAGALCALVFDNQAVGRQAAELAAQILAGTPVAELQTTIPDDLHLAINLRTAEIIGIKIPQTMREKATIVYE